MDLQQIANVLLEWGPAGAASVLMIVGEKKLRSRWDTAKGRDRKISSWLYTANWFFIAMLLTTLSIIWVIDRNRTTITMSGIVQDLRPNYRINDPTKALFTKTELKSNWLQNVHWHYSNPELPDVLEIRLENKSDFNDYSIPLDKVDDVLNIHVLFKNEKLWLKNKSGTIELESVHSASSELKQVALEYRNTPLLSLISLAHADELVDMSLIFDALGSEDSYIRQYSSQYLVENINSLISTIEEKLFSNDSSETIIIGLVSVLARASSPELAIKRKWNLSDDAKNKIFFLSFSENHVLATQSRRFLIRNVSDKYIKLLDSKCDYTIVGIKNDLEYCSFMALNLIYNLAIHKWVQSTEIPTEEAVSKIKEGLSILDDGLNLSQYASREKSIQFGKVFYGKAFLNHELSKITTNGSSDKAVKNAVKYFQILLRYLSEEYLNEYEYPHHALQAKCYIDEKSQRCFDEYLPK